MIPRVRGPHRVSLGLGCRGLGNDQGFHRQGCQHGPLRTKINKEVAMKYMISWFKRPQGSPAEYENAQKRVLEVFG